MNRNKVLLKTCENFSRTPRKTYKSPSPDLELVKQVSPDYIPPASIKTQNDDKIIKLLIKTYK